MNTQKNLARIRDFALKQRGNLKILAARAGVPYTTATRMADEDWYPAAFENLEKLIEALDTMEDGAQSPASSTEEAA